MAEKGAKEGAAEAMITPLTFKTEEMTERSFIRFLSPKASRSINEGWMAAAVQQLKDRRTTKRQIIRDNWLKKKVTHMDSLENPIPECARYRRQG